MLTDTVFVVEPTAVVEQLNQSIGKGAAANCSVFTVQVASPSGKIGFLTEDPAVFSLFSLLYGNAWAWDHVTDRAKSFAQERERLPRQDPSIFFNGSKGEWVAYHEPRAGSIEGEGDKGSDRPESSHMQRERLREAGNLPAEELFLAISKSLPYNKAISVFSQYAECPIFFLPIDGRDAFLSFLKDACSSLGFRYTFLQNENDLPVR